MLAQEAFHEMRLRRNLFISIPSLKYILLLDGLNLLLLMDPGWIVFSGSAWLAKQNATEGGKETPLSSSHPLEGLGEAEMVF